MFVGDGTGLIQVSRQAPSRWIGADIAPPAACSHRHQPVEQRHVTAWHHPPLGSRGYRRPAPPAVRSMPLLYLRLLAIIVLNRNLGFEDPTVLTCIDAFRKSFFDWPTVMPVLSCPVRSPLSMRLASDRAIRCTARDRPLLSPDQWPAYARLPALASSAHDRCSGRQSKRLRRGCVSLRQLFRAAQGLRPFPSWSTPVAQPRSLWPTDVNHDAMLYPGSSVNSESERSAKAAIFH